MTVLYASQTGTAQEIARSIQAASAQHSVKSQACCVFIAWLWRPSCSDQCASLEKYDKVRLPDGVTTHLQVMSCNELGWDALSPEKTPVIVLVASSTGDGDPPDNAAKFYATMKCVHSHNAASSSARSFG